MLSQTILGLDPGLASLGWGVVRSEGVRLSFVASGTVTTKSRQALPDRLLAIHNALSDVVREFEPTAFSIEETFVNKDQRAALKLAEARGVALLVPAQFGVSVNEYAPNLIKKSVVGAGHAAKAQVRAMVEHLLPGADISSEHAADALAAAIAHAHLAQTTARWADLTGAR